MTSAATADTDRALAQRAAAGDRASQRALFLAHRDGVHHALYRILGANRDIEDLLQEAFLAIFRSLASYRGDSSLARWCQVIATRTAYHWIAKRPPPQVELADDDLPGGEPAEQMRARAALRRLYAQLAKLDPKLRIAFALAHVDGRSLAEVAELTESSLVAVKTRVWRARRELARRAAQDPVLAEYLEGLR